MVLKHISKVYKVFEGIAMYLEGILMYIKTQECISTIYR
jgi:hypothetical protein